MYREWFEDWKLYHKRSYATPAAELEAFETWCVNMDHIREINHDDSKTYWASGNQ